MREDVACVTTFPIGQYLANIHWAHSGTIVVFQVNNINIHEI